MISRAGLAKAVCAHFALGLSFAVFAAPFYGDALNFLGYREALSDPLNWQFEDLNGAAVALLYGDVARSALVNTALLLFTWSVVRSSSNFRRLQPLFYSATVALLLSPSLVTRFGEPSREYPQSLLLFLGGSFALTNSPLSVLFLATASIFRPVAAPSYFLWSLLAIVYRRAGVRAAAVCATFVLGALFGLQAYIGPENAVLAFYQSRLGDYGGVLGDSPPIVWKVLLNVFGDVNAFAAPAYSTAERIVYLLDYVWRLWAIFLIVRSIRGIGVVLAVFNTVVLALVLPFPHPRYFVPVIFFLLGLTASVRSVRQSAETKRVRLSSVTRPAA